MSTGGSIDLNLTLVAEVTSLANPVTYYFQKTGKYPNNSEIWWSMKRPPELGTDAPPKQYLEVFDPGLRYQLFTGGTPAPKGHYILNAFFQDRSNVSNIDGLDVVSSSFERPRAIAFFAGRVWYAGVQAAKFSSNIYFSPVLEKPEQVGNCFQQFDPTAEELRDLLPSDGGVIVIPEVSIVHHMFPFGQSLLVFAENGIWRISGSEGIGFRANDYSITKVSGVPSVSNLSFVDVEGYPMWWNRSGINTITTDEQGTMVVKSLTDETIKTFFDAIPEQSKFNAKGTYDPLTKTVQFVYRSGEATVVVDPPPPSYLLREDGGFILREDGGKIIRQDGSFTAVEQFEYDRVLVFDTRTQAWMPWSISSNFNVKLLGAISIQGRAIRQTDSTVVVLDDPVEADGEEVLVQITTTENVNSVVKYPVSLTYEGVTFAQEYREDYTDFYTVDNVGSDYLSYAVSGYGVYGDGNRKFQGNYITVNYEVLEDAQCYIQGLWDWTENDVNGRWSQPQYIYALNDEGYKHYKRRLKIRGAGNALQIRIESKSGKAFSINGWTLLTTGNGVP